MNIFFDNYRLKNSSNFFIVFMVLVLLIFNCSVPNPSNSGGSDSNQEQPDPADFDTQVLRYNASFRVEVSSRVYWVPANTLGKPDLTNNDIQNMVGDNPYDLQNEIDNLYEVIQYLAASNFIGSSDNIRILEGTINWEHHKPGYLSITTNEGNCATISNLLNFLLKDDYEEVGFIQYSRSNGNGHVFNFIKQNNLFYIIDLTNYRNDFLNSVIETGNKYDYDNGNNRIIANVHETDNLINYVTYYRDNCTADVPVLFNYYSAENALPIDSVNSPPNMFITYPDVCAPMINIIFDDLTDNVSYAYAIPPVLYPDEWEPYNTKY